MKQLQNEISRISTDLIQHLKIKIISISVLNQYFFENFNFQIELNLIDIESILIVFCIDFSISPILVCGSLRQLKTVVFMYWCLICSVLMLGINTLAYYAEASVLTKKMF